jgi:hypothetical protein
MDWYLAIFTTIGGAIGGVGTWFFGIRKQRAETTGTEYDNFQKFVLANREIIGDLKTQIFDLIEANGALREKVNTLEEEIDKLKQEFPCESCPRRKLPKQR